MLVGRKRLLGVLTTGAIICGAALPTPALAATGGITMSPAIKELTISSGLVEAHSAVTLTNHTKQNVVIQTRVVDLSDISQGGGLVFGQNSLALAKYGLANWMVLPGGNQAALASGATVNIPVVVQNRSDLAPGGHYGAVVMTASSGVSGNSVGFKQELVSLVLVKKLGGEQYGLKLESIKPDSDTSQNIVTLKFRGTGNVHVVPRGVVQLTDARDKLLAKGIINPESTIVLPGGSRQFVTIMKPVASSNAPGRHKLTVYYRPEGRAEFESKMIYLSNWPWYYTLLIALLVVAVGLVLRRRRLRQLFRLR